MSSGFNTDVKVGTHVFHVQTEDRGPNHPILDTVVYQNGRILHRRASNYEQGADAAPYTPEELRRRVEEQHRAVIEALRSGRSRRGNCFGGGCDAGEPPPWHPGAAAESRIVAFGREKSRSSWKFRARRIASRSPAPR